MFSSNHGQYKFQLKEKKVKTFSINISVYPTSKRNSYLTSSMQKTLSFTHLITPYSLMSTL